MLRSILLVLCLSFVGPSVAQASDDPEVSRLHYDTGKRYYDVGQYDQALRQFKSAYLAKPDPALIYNIAQCHRQLNQPQEAIKLYKRYLAMLPKATNRKEVENRIGEMEYMLKFGRAPESQSQPQAHGPQAAPASRDQTVTVRVQPVAPEPAAVPAPATQVTSSAQVTQQKSRMPWIVGGATVLAAGATLLSGLSAKSDFEHLRDTCGQTTDGCSDADVNTLKNRALLTNALLGLTAVGAIATGTLFYLDAGKEHASVGMVARF